MNVYDGNKKQSHSSGKSENDNIKIKSNAHIKINIMIVGDFLVEYLRREELSSKKKNVKVITHPGCTTEEKTCLITLGQLHGENLTLE